MCRVPRYLAVLLSSLCNECNCWCWCCCSGAWGFVGILRAAKLERKARIVMELACSLEHEQTAHALLAWPVRRQAPRIFLTPGHTRWSITCEWRRDTYVCWLHQALMGRYSRAEDVVVGTPLANRSRPELEGLIGYFVNTVALRTDLSGPPDAAHFHCSSSRFLASFEAIHGADCLMLSFVILLYPWWLFVILHSLLASI